ncbi:MAG TPA: hypothetical protein VMC09_08255 [Anaerolineales bacterium]|nr:hypothetical protein [Anaerolineales bacterium]
MSPEPIEERLDHLRPSPSPRFYRRMSRAAWTPVAIARRRVLLTTGLTLMIAVVLLAFTPQGRAWAQQALRFFTRASGDTLPAPTIPTMRWVDQTPGRPAPTLIPEEPTQPAFSADCGDIHAPRCTFAQIRSKVNFKVEQLGVIPAGLYFIGATGGPDAVELIYDSADHGGFLYLREEPWTGSSKQTAWQVGASAVVESVRIGDLSGEYVRGTFMMKDGDQTVTWDAQADEQTLHWVDGGVFYEMQSAGPVLPVDRQAFVSLAASLTTGSVAASLTPMPPTPTANTFNFQSAFPLTIPQAEQQAGFPVLAPSKLPAILSFVGARINTPDELIPGAVTLFYLLDQNIQGPNTDGLFLQEQPVPDQARCTWCGFRVGDSAAVWADTTASVVGSGIQMVQVGDAQGEYVQGVWTGRNNNGTWAWEPDQPVKRLRWRANGVAFELSYYGDDISQADMLAIAGSIRR